MTDCPHAPSIAKVTAWTTFTASRLHVQVASVINAPSSLLSWKGNLAGCGRCPRRWHKRTDGIWRLGTTSWPHGTSLWEIHASQEVFEAGGINLPETNSPSGSKKPGLPKGSKEPKTHAEVGTKNPGHSTTLSNHASSGTKNRSAHPESPCCWYSKYDFRIRRTRMQVPSQLIQDGVSQESPILSLAVKHQHADPVGICRGGD